MASLDTLLAEYKIDSPGDRALVRVVGLAVTEATDKDALLASSGLANKHDLAMAGALIETVRSARAGSSPAASPSRTPWVALAFALTLLAGGTVAYVRARAEAVEQGSKLAALADTQKTELAAVRKELADLVQKTSSSLTGAGQSAEAFRAATADYLTQKDALNREIQRLNAELTTLKEPRK
jgi:putative intracellular protease/amidase